MTNLILWGHRISENEQVLTLTNGLDEEYESLVTYLATQTNLPDIQFVYSALLAHEGRVEQRKAIQNDYSINFASNSRNSNQSRSVPGLGRGNNQGQRGNPNARGRGRGRSNNTYRVKCQICEKPGHTANRCYFRFNSDVNNAQQNQFNQRGPNVNMAQSSQQGRNNTESTAAQQR